jgi:hypothetical protein
VKDRVEHLAFAAKISSRVVDLLLGGGRVDLAEELEK